MTTSRMTTSSLIDVGVTTLYQEARGSQPAGKLRILALIIPKRRLVMMSLKKVLLVSLAALLLAAVAGAIPSQPLASGIIVTRFVGTGVNQTRVIAAGIIQQSPVIGAGIIVNRKAGGGPQDY
ncbi:MAG: hypothetical protein ACRDJE_12430 [Dehalococcoidia bacterium]